MNAPLWLQVATASAVTFAVAMFALVLYLKWKDREDEQMGVEMHVSPYIRRATLLTAAEQRFYVRLFQAVGNEVLICPKVRLADVIEVRGDTLEWQSAWNRIAAKHIDFLLTTVDDHQPLLAIELDDSSHHMPNRQKRDEWLDRAMVAAGLPLMRVRVRSDYDPAGLRREVEGRLATAVH
ncbi:MAG TPA: DUF2726 domain-containing protein [Symbiobacteriaceae bacterium]|nr:DUF2726 domain-containing protein [Symbiobacteriaceae bacterium]